MSVIIVVESYMKGFPNISKHKQDWLVTPHRVMPIFVLSFFSVCCVD